IGDRFTMGPDHASKAAEVIKAPVAVPCHFGTWPLLVSDAAGFTPAGVDVRVLDPGGSIGF
ncbi:MAG: metal-dependent hydrolase, partial [Planctomycetota bacterium]